MLLAAESVFAEADNYYLVIVWINESLVHEIFQSRNRRDRIDNREK